MLDQGQLVLAAAGVGDQALGQLLAHLAAVERRRFADRAQQRRAFHPRQQVLGLVDCLGQALEAGAMPEELRAHGQDGVEPGRRLLLQADQQVDKQPRLLGTAPFGEGEQLLELVDQDADVVGFVATEEVGQHLGCTPAAIENVADVEDLIGRGLVGEQAGERPGEVAERVLARQHRAGAPARVGGGVALLQLDQDARTHDR